MDAKIEPPIQAPNRLSAEPLAEMIFKRILLGIRTERSLFNRSGKPCVKMELVSVLEERERAK